MQQKNIVNTYEDDVSFQFIWMFVTGNYAHAFLGHFKCKCNYEMHNYTS